MNQNDSAQESQLPRRALQKLLDNSEGRSFLIVPNVQAGQFNIILHENISPSDVIEAYARAVFTATLCNLSENAQEKLRQELNGMSDAVTEDWEMFRNCVTAAGFNTSISLLKTGDWRAKWKHS